MAKKMNGKTNIALAGLVITVIVIATSGMTSYLNGEFKTDDTAKHIEEMKVDGCDPSIRADKEIAVLKSQLGGIIEDVSYLQKQQDADTDRILQSNVALSTQQKAETDRILQSNAQLLQAIKDIP